MNKTTSVDSREALNASWEENTNRAAPESQCIVSKEERSGEESVQMQNRDIAADLSSAKSMQNGAGLSCEEREQNLRSLSTIEQKYWSDIVRGDQSPVMFEQNSDYVFSALFEMQKQLDNFPSSCKGAYIRGILLHSQYIFSQELRIKFLRAEDFHIRKAAERFCFWLDLLVKNFGDVAVVRKIRMEDLSKDEMSLLREGICQILPARDRIGRRVLTVVSASKWSKYPIECRMKVILYLGQVLSEDILSTHLGFVFNFWPDNGSQSLLLDATITSKMRRVLSCVPIRCTGNHICLPSVGFLKTAQAFFGMAHPADHGKVVRIHSGTKIEIEYILETEYGIPSKEIPLTGTGRVKVKNLNMWIHYRSKFERSQEAHISFEGIECPDFHTIAIRNGGIMFQHPPNKVFRSYLREYEERRRTAKTNEAKQKIIEEIACELEGAGFRFARWSGDDGYYLPMTSPQEIRVTIASALRDQSKRTKAERNRKNQQGSAGVEDGFLSLERKRSTTATKDCSCIRLGNPK